MVTERIIIMKNYLCVFISLFFYFTLVLHRQEYIMNISREEKKNKKVKYVENDTNKLINT